MANLSATQIQMVHTDHEVEDIIVSYSTREASYCRHGWTKRSAKASLWSLGGSRESSSDTTSSHSSSSNTISVIGRYVHSKCILTLGKQLPVHPMFKAAVEAALVISAESERAAELTDVFERFGHVYVSSVEMGGMKHIVSTKASDSQVSCFLIMRSMSFTVRSSVPRSNLKTRCAGPLGRSSVLPIWAAVEKKDRPVSLRPEKHWALSDARCRLL